MKLKPWADWKFTTSFGCPTFLNFGKSYAGARDEFVYIYSLAKWMSADGRTVQLAFSGDDLFSVRPGTLVLEIGTDRHSHPRIRTGTVIPIIES